MIFVLEIISLINSLSDFLFLKKLRYILAIFKSSEIFTLVTVNNPAFEMGICVKNISDKIDFNSSPTLSDLV